MDNVFTNNSFLGKGWNFPPAFNIHHATTNMVKEEEDIEQSLQILLSTQPGERVMHPDYGCNLRQLVFEPLSNALASVVKDTIRTAIIRFEPRITPEKIDIQPTYTGQNVGLLLISLEYIIKTTNARSNLVFPYYIEEGTNIEEKYK
ncbi:MAG: GPW/gp25 family protein [Chitinophagaceae bacterium]